MAGFLISRATDALPDEERAMLERARALIPRLAERAPAATAARQLPAETIAEYHAAGILRILQPRRFGGHAGPVQPVLADRRGVDLWLRLLGLGLRGAGRASVDHRAISRSRRRSMSGATIPKRSPRPRWRRAPPPSASPGGWRLSGRYPFSSGCDYAQWAILGAFLGEMGDPRTSPICWCRSPRSRSSTTGRCSASPAPAASRWSCATCSFPSTAA